MPERSEDLETRLSAFATDGPVALPGAAAARRRGDQRTRRTRSALAGGGAAVLVLVLAAVLGGVVDAGGEDRVSIPAATPAPAAPDPLLVDALLDADDVTEALGGRWPVRTPQDAEASTAPLPEDCASGAEVSGSDAAQRSFGLGGRAEQVLVRYAEPEEAVLAYDRLVAIVEQCPATQTPTTRAAGGLPGVRFLAERVLPEGTVHLSVERRGPFLLAVSASSPDALQALADAADAELVGALAGNPDRLVDVLPGGPDVRGALLEPPDAERLSPGAQWSFSFRSADGSDELPTFPCATGPAPNAAGDGRVTAGVRLSVEGEAGRTVVQQDVEQHTGPTTAAQAYDRVRARVAACPEQSLPDASGPGSVVTEVVDAGPELVDGVRTLLVRAEPDCRDCSATTAWFAVQQAGSVLSTLRVDPPEGAEGGVALVQPFAQAVADKLRATG